MRPILFIATAAAATSLAGHAISMPLGANMQAAAGSVIQHVHDGNCHYAHMDHPNDAGGVHRHFLDRGDCTVLYSQQLQPGYGNNLIIRPELGFGGNQNQGYQDNEGGGFDVIIQF